MSNLQLFMNRISTHLHHATIISHLLKPKPIFLLKSLKGLRLTTDCVSILNCHWSRLRLLLEWYNHHDQSGEIANGHCCVSFYMVNQPFSKCNSILLHRLVDNSHFLHGHCNGMVLWIGLSRYLSYQRIMHFKLIWTDIHCRHFVSMYLENMFLLHKSPVHCPVSLYTLFAYFSSQ